jgi:hypothetical protein
LHGVLGVVLGVQDVAAEHQQLASVAVIEDLKRRQVAAAHERHEAGHPPQSEATRDHERRARLRLLDGD